MELAGMTTDESRHVVWVLKRRLHEESDDKARSIFEMESHRENVELMNYIHRDLSLSALEME